MKVFFTPRARRRAATVARWWQAHRPAAPHLFVEELAAAQQALRREPSVGAVYATIGEREIRRLLLPRTEQYLYYGV